MSEREYALWDAQKGIFKVSDEREIEVEVDPVMKLNDIIRFDWREGVKAAIAEELKKEQLKVKML